MIFKAVLSNGVTKMINLRYVTSVNLYKKDVSIRILSQQTGSGLMICGFGYYGQSRDKIDLTYSTEQDALNVFKEIETKLEKL
jgi:hypothetical protein